MRQLGVPPSRGSPYGGGRPEGQHDVSVPWREPGSKKNTTCCFREKRVPRHKFPTAGIGREPRRRGSYGRRPSAQVSATPDASSHLTPTPGRTEPTRRAGRWADRTDALLRHHPGLEYDLPRYSLLCCNHNRCGKNRGDCLSSYQAVLSRDLCGFGCWCFGPRGRCSWEQREFTKKKVFVAGGEGEKSCKT